MKRRSNNLPDAGYGVQIKEKRFRQRELRLREPGGSTMMLLELPEKEPRILDYRINKEITERR
ncbi:MAG TPA: hypothetical protein PK253_11405 [Spirochaetota bacterium]|nr:hypothetical protein [Spirochaetota bacterium]